MASWTSTNSANTKFIDDQEVNFEKEIKVLKKFVERPFWTPQTPTWRSDDLLTDWWSTGTWFTSLPSSPPSLWSSSTSMPLGWSTTSERFSQTFWFDTFQRYIQNFSGAVQRLRPGRRCWDNCEVASRDAGTGKTGEKDKIHTLWQLSYAGGTWETGVPRSTSCSSRKGSLLEYP